MEIFLFLAESDGHREEVLEFADEVMEQHDNFHQHLTVLEYSRLLRFFFFVSLQVQLKFVPTNSTNFVHQVGQILNQ